MKPAKKLILPLVLVFICSCASVRQQARQSTLEKTYPHKEEITILVSPISRYTIRASPDQNIHVRLNGDDHGVEYVIQETDRELRIGDKVLNYHPNRPTPRDVYQWTLELPKAAVKCTGGIARLNVDSFNGAISVTTGLGTMRFKRSKGTFNISTGLGNIRFDQCEGTFSVSSGNSDIAASKIIIGGESTFAANGGDVRVVLAKTPTQNLTISTGTSRGLLEYNGNPIVGRFKFSCEKGKGHIVSPYPFERQTTYQDDLKQIRRQEDFGKKVDYLLKEHVVGKPSPGIVVKTIRGSAVLKK